ncbi:MAG TPA: response regulator, partial [Bdellovibrionota bacterium]|nr:response regulator [Bdellovibrionota bacterium]
MMEEARQRELFKKFLADARIVIADTSSASRARLAKTLVDLGAKMQLIELCGTYASAEEAIRKSKPRLLVSDYHLGSRSGFDLLDALKDCGDPAKRVFALVTANSSQSTIARAAEEDVDVCVLKPYTIQMLSKALVAAAINKLHPSA